MKDTGKSHYLCKAILTGGGRGCRRILPAAALSLNNIFNIRANAMELDIVCFFRNLSGKNLFPVG